MSSSLSRVVLGTVQFGLDYGISNSEGKVSEDQVRRILNLGVKNGLSLVDTAAMYGSSEEVLGRVLPESISVITKLPKLELLRNGENLRDFLYREFTKSLEKLNTQSCYGLLLHNADDLLSSDGEEIYDFLSEIKSKDLVKKIGFSCYCPKQIEQIIKKYKVDIIQFPFNIIDRRFCDNDLLGRLKSEDIELHARSTFLQGLLLMEPKELDVFFEDFSPHLKKIQKYLHKNFPTVREGLLKSTLSIREIDYLVLGVVNERQLKEVCEDLSSDIDLEDWEGFRFDAEEIINPHLWKTHE